MESNIKQILERRIAGATDQINESERKIASEELYRNKWQIRKEAFVNILEEWNEAELKKDIVSAGELPHLNNNPVEISADCVGDQGGLGSRGLRGRETSRPSGMR